MSSIESGPFEMHATPRAEDYRTIASAINARLALEDRVCEEAIAKLEGTGIKSGSCHTVSRATRKQEIVSALPGSLGGLELRRRCVLSEWHPEPLLDPAREDNGRGEHELRANATALGVVAGGPEEAHGKGAAADQAGTEIVGEV